MDLPTVQTLLEPRHRQDIPSPTSGTAYLAGGTWLFSQPQPGLHTLVDLQSLAWPDLVPDDTGLTIAATCPIATLEAFANPLWPATAIFGPCCQALLGSFKVAAIATVGGNACLALPAAPILALATALDATALVWHPDGTQSRTPMRHFATGPGTTILRPGDLLRSIHLPASALRRRAALRQASLTPHGRSAALLLATTGPTTFTLTITAATTHPIHLAWPAPPTRATLDDAITALPATLWHDDVHGTPAWRRHMTRRLAPELLAGLLPGPGAGSGADPA